jgi:putative phosphoribosyl transferase
MFGAEGDNLRALKKGRCAMSFVHNQASLAKSGKPAAARRRDVEIPPRGLAGVLSLPAGAGALVIFAHGSGSSRFSPRNVMVADALNRRRFATLLFDLLLPGEDEDRGNVFDVHLLGRRLVDALHWAEAEPDVAELPVGLFGASTGAAAALIAAASHGARVGAVVSRGGRPDLANDALRKVKAPTLLIVGGADEGVIELNQWALDGLACDKALEIVPGATHLFPEPGALEQVIELAAQWFARWLIAGKNQRDEDP